ncbi:hypothetical protein EGJ56_19825 [Pandoraea apista]|nr:hypothetical protein EGJ56_19825 [Pandoraea apista]
MHAVCDAPFCNLPAEPPSYRCCINANEGVMMPRTSVWMSGAVLAGTLVLTCGAVQAKSVSYLCDNSHVALVVYDDHNLGGNVTLYWMGKREILRPARAASGEKHVGPTLVWWSKGPEGTLYTARDERPITQCKE